MVLNKHKGKHMNRKLFLFAVILILAVSLVPLSGVSAQRAAPVSSADPAPAARATYYKQVKTQLIMYYGGSKAFKYVQKLYWGYNYSTVNYWSATMKGVVFQPSKVSYYGYALQSSFGGVGYTYYYRWTHGVFYWYPTSKYYYLDIEQEVYNNGTWWKNKFYHN
jgi:hypothetical protein